MSNTKENIVPVLSKENQNCECHICGDFSMPVGWHYGAVTCEACKKFFWRAEKGKISKIVCHRNKQCVITPTSRVNCQYCRYDKCIQLGMSLEKKSIDLKADDIQFKCTICGQPSNGIHFGVITCEGCKGFFGRSIKNNKFESYKCKGNEDCSFNSRLLCRYCRFKKCLNSGMSSESCVLGRQTNLLKKKLFDVKQEQKSEKHKLEEISLSPKENIEEMPCAKRAKLENQNEASEYTLVKLTEPNYSEISTPNDFSKSSSIIQPCPRTEFYSNDNNNFIPNLNLIDLTNIEFNFITDTNLSDSSDIPFMFHQQNVVLDIYSTNNNQTIDGFNYQIQGNDISNTSFVTSNLFRVEPFDQILFDC